jgi:hypothetical protein
MMEELKKLLKCPLDWSGFPMQDWDESILKADWYFAMASRGFEMTDLPDGALELEMLEGDDYEIQQLISNLTMRRKETLAFYMANCAGKLHGLTFLTPAEHGKHYIPSMGRQEIVSKTNYSDSLFLENLRSDELKLEFWNWVDTFFGGKWDLASYDMMMDPEEEVYNDPESKLWRRLIREPHVRICMEMSTAIGASRGVLTKYICYDIHTDTHVAHCYPVTEMDAIAIMGDAPVINCDELNRTE